MNLKTKKVHWPAYTLSISQATCVLLFMTNHFQKTRQKKRKENEDGDTKRTRDLPSAVSSVHGCVQVTSTGHMQGPLSVMAHWQRCAGDLTPTKRQSSHDLWLLLWLASGI